MIDVSLNWCHFASGVSRYGRGCGDFDYFGRFF